MTAAAEVGAARPGAAAGARAERGGRRLDLAGRRAGEALPGERRGPRCRPPVLTACARLDGAGSGRETKARPGHPLPHLCGAGRARG